MERNNGFNDHIDTLGGEEFDLDEDGSVMSSVVDRYSLFTSAPHA